MNTGPVDCWFGSIIIESHQACPSSSTVLKIEMVKQGEKPIAGIFLQRVTARSYVLSSMFSYYIPITFSLPIHSNIPLQSTTISCTCNVTNHSRKYRKMIKMKQVEGKVGTSKWQITVIPHNIGPEMH